MDRSVFGMVQERQKCDVLGSQNETGPYVPAAPSAAIASQVPPFWPRRPHASFRSGPTIADVFDVVGEKRHATEFSMHAHAASFGVGGSEVLARKVEFCVGQAGKVVVPEALGLFGGLIALYWALRRSKSFEVVTVEPSEEMLTMPN